MANYSANTGTDPIRGYSFDRNNTTTFQKDQWETEVWRELDANLIMMNTVLEVPQGLITGKSYYQPKVGRMATKNKIPGNSVNLQAYKEDQFSMEFKRYQESSTMIEDISELFAEWNIRSEYVREIGYSIAEDVDNWVLGYRAVIQKLGNFVSAGAGNALNRATILAAKLKMDLLKVPQNDRMWIFSPSQLVSLLTIPEFTSGDYVSGQPTMTGEIGSLYGYPVIINNFIGKNSATGLSIISGVDGSGNRVYTNVPTPGFATWSGAAVVSPYYPNKTLNGDANGAGQHTELVVTSGTQDSLPVNAYTGMLVRKGWLKFGWAQKPKSETGRETTFVSDVIVTTTLYDAKVYRPENCILIHSFEAV